MAETVSVMDNVDDQDSAGKRRVSWESFELLAYGGAAIVTVLAVLQSISALVTYLQSRTGPSHGGPNVGARNVLAGTSWSDTAVIILIVVLALAWTTTRRWSSISQAADAEFDGEEARDEAAEQDPNRDQSVEINDGLEEEPGSSVGWSDEDFEDAVVARHLARVDALSVWVGFLLLVTVVAAALRIVAVVLGTYPLTSGTLASTLIYECQPLLLALIAAAVGLTVAYRIRRLCGLRWGTATEQQFADAQP